MVFLTLVFQRKRYYMRFHMKFTNFTCFFTVNIKAHFFVNDDVRRQSGMYRATLCRLNGRIFMPLKVVNLHNAKRLPHK